jgi:hypothetical protein
MIKSNKKSNKKNSFKHKNCWSVLIILRTLSKSITTLNKYKIHKKLNNNTNLFQLIKQIPKI